MDCEAVLRVEQPVLQPAQCGDLAVELDAFLGRQYQPCRVGVEEAQRHVGAVSDIAQVFQHTGLAGALEVRRQDVADVGAQLLGVQRELDGLLRGVGARHHLHQRAGFDPSGLLDRDPDYFFEFVGGQ